MDLLVTNTITKALSRAGKTTAMVAKTGNINDCKVMEVKEKVVFA
jgi:hypothetical protein